MLENINDFNSVEKADFSTCLDVIEHSHQISGIDTTLRFHHFKFNANKQPMIKALANTLYSYIIDYCLSAKNRNEKLSNRQAAILTKEARKLFRHPEITDESPDKTGEAGETLLYFLMEAVLDAPQIVAKMELKTNHKDEVKGSDGIHAKWNDELNIVDFYFGEAKLYKKVASAIDSALQSISDFHDIKMYEHEFSMVTKHFKYADESIKEQVSNLFIHGEAGSGVRVNHSCLIGYDFNGYETCSGKNHIEIEKNFRDLFINDSIRITSLLQNKFDKFNKKHLAFDVFMIPFPSVVEFRNAFNEALD